MELSFVKLEGLGNDFVVIDRREAGVPVEASAAIRLCDRHRGIGADGVLSLMRSERAPIAMHVTNADGSIAEMCGNGLRCVVRYAVDRGLLPPEGGPVDTGRGVLDCRVEPDGQVRVDMGAPRLQPQDVPVALPGERIIEAPLLIDDREFHFTAVSMGNPHAITFVDGPESLVDLARRWGPLVERDARFPNRTNVEFARIAGPEHIDLVVWERGSGLTQACGTGACATAVAATLTGRVSPGVPVAVDLPGGRLRIEVEPALARVWMTGPAREVFDGRIRLS